MIVHLILHRICAPKFRVISLALLISGGMMMINPRKCCGWRVLPIWFAWLAKHRLDGWSSAHWITPQILPPSSKLRLGLSPITRLSISSPRPRHRFDIPANLHLFKYNGISNLANLRARIVEAASKLYIYIYTHGRNVVVFLCNSLTQ